MAYTTIDNPELWFQCKTYAGDGNSTQAITLDGEEDMQPDLVWIKNRTDEVWHVWSDSIAGAGAANDLAPNSDEAAGGGNKASYGFLSAFGSDGFTVSEGSSNASMSNQSSKNYVAWCWKAGTAFSNDASATSIGSIDSSGTVSTTAGFSICSYSGSGSAATVKHGLSTKPNVMIIKNRVTASKDWQVYSPVDDPTDALALNQSDATGDSDVYWNDTAPTSSVFSVKSGATNTSGASTTGYIFHDVQGFSKFGEYAGNGNADGVFVFLGFKPALIIIKRTDSTNWWVLKDNKRSQTNGNNVNKYIIYPNDDSAEGTDSNHMDLLSNGFKYRDTASAGNNADNSFIYMAWAEQPFVNSNGIPCNAK